MAAQAQIGCASVALGCGKFVSARSVRAGRRKACVEVGAHTLVLPIAPPRRGLRGTAACCGILCCCSHSRRGRGASCRGAGGSGASSWPSCDAHVMCARLANELEAVASDLPCAWSFGPCGGALFVIISHLKFIGLLANRGHTGMFALGACVVHQLIGVCDSGERSSARSAFWKP